jgi:hypothetical protein
MSSATRSSIEDPVTAYPNALRVPDSLPVGKYNNINWLRISRQTEGRVRDFDLAIIRHEAMRDIAFSPGSPHPTAMNSRTGENHFSYLMNIRTDRLESRCSL